VAEPPPPKEKRAEREAARPAKAERTAPAREQGRKEPQVAAAARPATAPAPAPAPAAPPPPAPEPQQAQAPLFAPAQQEQTPTAAPLQLGPTYAREGMRKARMADPACLGSNLRLPPDVSLDGESATVKFAVDEKGAVSRYEYLAGPTDARVSKAIWNAIQRCEFVPGASAQGQPIQLWVTMPVRFGK
jgi:TonB family protein